MYRLLFFFFLCSFSLFAQSPQAINYQLIVRDSVGNSLQDQPVSIQISILQGSIAGTAVYEETHAIQTNSFGLANVLIGNGNITSGSFTAIDWSSGPYFIETSIDPSGNGIYEVIATTQFLSVPYALYAEKAPVDTAALINIINNLGLGGGSNNNTLIYTIRGF